MILVFGGTTEANNLTEALLKDGHSITVSVTTKLGRKKLTSTLSYSYPNNRHCAVPACLSADTAGRQEEAKSRRGHLNKKTLQIITGELDKKKIINLLESNKYGAVIDATHPFAVQVSKNAKEACRKTTTPYFRLARQSEKVIGGGLIIKTSSYKEAAKQATKLGKNIFLSIGANNVEVFAKEAKKSGSIISARVLEEKSSVDKCLTFGVNNENIISAKGPFTTAQNIEHFLMFQSDIVVSKDSGQAGGLTEKVKACAQLDLPLILIERPQQDENAFYEIDDLLRRVQKNWAS